MKSWLIVLAASVLLFGEAAAQVPGTRSSEVVSMAGTDYYLHRVARAKRSIPCRGCTVSPRSVFTKTIRR